MATKSVRYQRNRFQKMNRLLTALILISFAVAGCGLGVSKYDDAIMDGASNLNTGKPEKALEDFNRAIKIDPQKAAGYLGRANTLNIMGRYQEAIDDYDRTLDINPQLANAYINRASAYSHLGAYEKAIVDYVTKIKENRLELADLEGGTFTVSNGGVYGSLLSTPILNMPQSGILGMHKIEKRPVVIDDQIVIRPMMYVALSYDHRIVDGKGAVTFLRRVKEFLENPERILLEV